MSKPLMLHVVAGYPDKQACLELMKGMSDLGVAAIEVQIPFSDPIADGEAIMHANDVALENGMTTAASFALIQEAALRCDVYIMSYLQKVQHFGLRQFCEQAVKSGVKGLIIPDLPYDSPDYVRIVKMLGKLELVPVLSPGMSETRLQAALDEKPPRVYVTSQRGITGNVYHDTQELHKLIRGIRSSSDAAVMIGFGISTPEDVKDALQLADIAVVGSAVIKQLQLADMAKALNYIGTLTEAAA